MKKTLRKMAAVLVCLAMLPSGLTASAAESGGDAAETRRLIELVNDYWTSVNLNVPGYDWANAAYYVGNTQAYLVTGIEAYRENALKWGERNNWAGAAGSTTNVWTKSGVFHADNQTCFQTYLDLYFLDGDESKIARVLEVMDSQIHSAPIYYWDWDDALFMAMPVMSRLYRTTGDGLYADKLYAYFSACRDALYNKEYHIFFRDSSYINSTVQGQKNFWARGNGWVMASLAQTLRDMPETWEHYDEMLTVFREMAAGATACMKDDGQGNKYWTQSMLPKYPVSEENPNGYETSGTAFMTYALMYGINAGLLDEGTYLPYALGGINYLKNVAIQPNGLVGYVQEVGAAATNANAQNATQNFGVGATLLALCEYYKYQGGLNSSNDLLPYLTWRTNNTAVMKVGCPYIFAGGEVTAAPAPYRDGDVYLPLRALAEAMGYAVEWDSDGGFVSVYDSNESVIFVPGSSTVRRNGAAVSISAPVVSGAAGLYLSVSAAASAFDRCAGTSGELMYIGPKQQIFLPCETAAEQLLDGILTSGALPARPTQTPKGFVFNIASSVSGGTAVIPVESLLDMEGALKVVGCSNASSIPQPENPPASAYDGNISTRYAAIDFNAVFDLGDVKQVSDIALCFWQYQVRTTAYELYVSADGVNYTALFSGNSTLGQPFDRHAVNADIRYIKIIGHGNSNGEWTSLLEIVPFG